MKKINCRVCGREAEVPEDFSEDWVCSTCCDLCITSKEELRDYLEHSIRKRHTGQYVRDTHQSSSNKEVKQSR